MRHLHAIFTLERGYGARKSTLVLRKLNTLSVDILTDSIGDTEKEKEDWKALLH